MNMLMRGVSVRTMTRIAGALGRTVLLAALLAAALGAGTATAWARVHVDADSAVAATKRC